MQIVNLLDRQGVQVTPKTHIKSVYNTDNESLGDLLSFTGNTVTINNTVVADRFVGDLTGNADTATVWQTTRTLILTGDTTGSVTVDGSSNMTLEVEVLDDSHNHTISNVDGLQDALDSMSSDFNTSLTDLEADLTEKIETVESSLTVKIETTETTINQTISDLSDEINTKIDTVKSELSEDISDLDDKIDSVNDSLTESINDLKNSISDVEGTLTGSYATIEYVDSADSTTLTSAKSYTDTEISDLSSEVDTKLSTKADLVDGYVPSSQLPSYVDDVLEYSSYSALPSTGESGKIYVTLDDNLTYRWSGTTYVEISASLAIGETASTAFAGSRGVALEEKVSTIESTYATKTEVSESLEDAKDYTDEQIASIEHPTYTGVSPITVSGTSISHSTSGVTSGSYGQSSASTLSNGGSFTVPYITVNTYGHVTSASGYTVTLPTFTGTSPITVSGTAISHSTSGVTAGSYGPTASSSPGSAGTFAVPQITVDTYGHVTSVTARTITMPTVSTYSAGTGLSLSGTTFNHSNSVTASNVGPTAAVSPSPGGTFTVPYIAYDAQGHITSTASRTITVPSYTGTSPITVSGTSITHATSGVTSGSYGPTANTSPGSAGTFTVPQVTVDTYGHVTSVTARTITMPTVTSYSAGTGISISSNTINHSNSITSGTVGPSADSTLTSGGTFTVPYVAYDAQGHITSVSNRTMTMPTISSGVTVSNSTSTFYLTGTTSTGTISTFYRAASVYISSGTSVYASSGFYVTSSREFKENIVPAKENALELIDSLEIVDFTYKDDETKHGRIGFIAEDTPAIFLDKEGSHSDVYNCIGVLLKAVQELSTEVKELKARLSK